MTTTQIAPENLCTYLDGLFTCESNHSVPETYSPITEPRVLASYKNLEGNSEFAICCELGLANSLGAALSMIPPGGAEDATANGEVPTNIGENLYEVLNICSAAFADYCGYRIVLDRVFSPGDEIDNDWVSRVDTGECLLQINYGFDRYQSGNISLIKTA